MRLLGAAILFLFFQSFANPCVATLANLRFAQRYNPVTKVGRVRAYAVEAGGTEKLVAEANYFIKKHEPVIRVEIEYD